MRLNKFILALIIILVIFRSAYPCTIGLASNNITSSNRQLLWKARDVTPNTINSIRYVENMNYSFVGITSPGENRAWMGVNEMGFAIANSLSNDLTVTTGIFNNGNLIYNSLGFSGNLADFENYLDFLIDESNIELELRGNFVAFDAQGNSRLYEVNNNSYWVFPINDENQYQIRTNFSVTGGGSDGHQRYIRSRDIINQLIEENRLSVVDLFSQHFRDSSNFFSEPYDLPMVWGDPTPVLNTNYSICRRSTISAVVIEGVEAGQDPSLTTMWLLMGNPYVSTAIPILPLMTSDYETINNLSVNSRELIEQLWTPESGYLLDTSSFVNSQGFSLLGLLQQQEDIRYSTTIEMIDQWSNNEITNANLQSFLIQQATDTLELSTELFYNFTPNITEEYQEEEIFIYPNPFREKVIIENTDKSMSITNIEIYNIKGQIVRKLQPENNSFEWKGRDDSNNPVSSGIYFLKIYRNDKIDIIKTVKIN